MEGSVDRVFLNTKQGAVVAGFRGKNGIHRGKVHVSGLLPPFLQKKENLPKSSQMIPLFPIFYLFHWPKQGLKSLICEGGWQSLSQLL